MPVDHPPPTPPPEHEGETHARPSTTAAMVHEEATRLAIQCLEQIDSQPDNTVDEGPRIEEHAGSERQSDDITVDVTRFGDTVEGPSTASNARTVQETPQLAQSDVPEICVTPHASPHGETLQSLIRYIDHTLNKNRHMFNKPPLGFETCPVCMFGFRPELAQQIGDYIPLTCNHWIHYRCWLHHVSRMDPNHDKCPICDQRLFNWEGLVTYMTCVREDVDVEIGDLPGGSYIDKGTMRTIDNEQDVYLNDCDFIEGVLARIYQNETLRSLYERDTAQLLASKKLKLDNTGSKLTPEQRIEREHPDPQDGSPNLTRILVVSTTFILDKKCPKSRLLSFSSDIGAALFAHLVYIKFERWLVENKWFTVRNTEGWWKLVEHKLRMHSQLWKMIHADD